MSASSPPWSSDRVSVRAAWRRVVGSCLLVAIVAVEPVAAQESAVCDVERLPGMISGFFQLTTAIGLIGLVVVWQADSLIELFTVRREQREGIKRHKRTALRSTVILIVLGPLYTVAGSVMNLPLAECVDLTPW
ncbi:hypothetical protein [Halorubrum trueperi]|uniref:Uncharacterized protein n=1 Tax=Halorubrum trueperi TaxID=2004704 RepID=A0ABD5UFZ4_9EURY